MNTEMIYTPPRSTIVNMANYRHMYKMVKIAAALLDDVPEDKYVKFMNGKRPFISEEALIDAFNAKGGPANKAKVILNEAVKRGYLSRLVSVSERGIELGDNYHDFIEKRGFFRLGYWRDSLKENNIFVTIVLSGLTTLILGQIIQAAIHFLF